MLEGSVFALRLTDHRAAELSQELGPLTVDRRDGWPARLDIGRGLALEAMEVSRVGHLASLLDWPRPTKSRARSAASTVYWAVRIAAANEKAVDQRMTVDYLLSTLSERDRTIVTLRFFENLTQSEIGARMGISQMHVSRLIRRSISALQAAS